MKIRALIADDEPLAREGVRQLLAAHSGVEIVGEARDGREAGQLLAMLSPDLLFLDIQMPELDGFEVLESAMRDGSTLVVFITAYDGFAVQAFDREAVDYLVKPISGQRFREMMDRVQRRIRERRLADRIAGNSPSRDVGEPGGLRKRFLIAPTDSGERLIDADDITWIEAFDYYVVVHARGRRFLLRESLTSLHARLDASLFLRVHRGALINLTHVREVRRGHGPDRVLLSDGAVAPVSRRRWRELMRAFRGFHL